MNPISFSVLRAAMFAGFALALLTSVSINAPQTHAQVSGNGIANTVFCILNGIGSPVNVFDNAECQNQGGQVTQCSDGIDNDNDGFVDANDPGCHTDGDPSNDSSYDPTDNSESGPLPQCWNGIDDDHDGLVDWNPLPGQGDPDCSTPLDDSEQGTTPPSSNTAPVAQNLSVTTQQDTATSSQVKATDADSDPLTYGVVSGPSNGTLSFNTDGTFTYTPGSGYTGADSFTFEANDGTASSSPATVSITVNASGNNGGGGDNGGDNGGNNGGSTQCSDGIDNDGDGKIDLEDPGCFNSQDNDESNASGGGGSSSSRSSGGSSSSLPGIVLGTSTEAAPDCSEYLHAYIRQGQQNDPSEVLKLQIFLNNFEGNTLALSGVYDNATLAAVNAFQLKYAPDILTPWGATRATGYVYYTTRREINTIYCQNEKRFPLTDAQKAEIARVKALGDAWQPAGSGQAATNGIDPQAVVLPQDSSTSSDEENTGSVSSQSAQTAAANASGQGGNWFSNFIGWLFGSNR